MPYKNKEDALAWKRKNYALHSEREKKRSSQWYHAHKEQAREATKRRLQELVEHNGQIVTRMKRNNLRNQEKNGDKIRAHARAMYWANPEESRRKHREGWQKLRLEVLTYYSSGTLCCNCCGESDFVVLCLDHVNNDGAEQRRRYGNAYGVYQRVKKQGFPEGYQVLCWNCNARKAYGGSKIWRPK